MNEKKCLIVCLTLTHLVLRVLLVDYEQATLATHNLAVGSTLLQRCSCLHIVTIGLLVSKHDSSFGQVVGTHLHLHLVARENLNVVHTHFARYVCYDLHAILKLNAEHRIGERLNYRPVLFNSGLLCHLVNVSLLLFVLSLQKRTVSLPSHA